MDRSTNGVKPFDLAPGESKQVQLTIDKVPLAMKKAVLKVYWKCEGCKHEHGQKFSVSLGKPSNLVEFSCPCCDSLWGRIRALFTKK
jgi:hypothetical protein